MIQPASLGDGLGILAKFAAAIILFEGSLNLRLPVLRQSIIEVRDLISAGTLITWVLVSLIAHFAGRLSWELAIYIRSVDDGRPVTSVTLNIRTQRSAAIR